MRKPLLRLSMIYNNISSLKDRFLKVGCTAFFLAVALSPQAQQVKDSTFVTRSASLKYDKSPKYQKKWGKHYREEWKTPVRFKVALLDTLKGGLAPYQKGGGRQSKTLRLRNSNNEEYVLRSIDKSFGKALPEIAQGTFIETFINDQVTISHPYAAITVAPMAEAAGILHTWPEIYFIPKQKSLGPFNDMGDELYLLEQRPDEDWRSAKNFGNAEEIYGTDKMIEKILKKNDASVDQALFARSRLFDMFIGDWSRHEDQWRWAEIKQGGKTIYKPVPRDRDQAYSLFDGSQLRIAISLSGLSHLQSFSNTIPPPEDYNFPARNLDHHFTNTLSKEQWLLIANDLRSRLTDKVIIDAFRRLPPDIYSISGEQIVEKLKARREQLPSIAEKYYLYLAKESDIAGSSENEQFTINRYKDSTTITINSIEKNGLGKTYFQQTWYTNLTKEIRIYGIDGNDRYKLSGNGNKIKLRLIGGIGKDEYFQENYSGRRRSLIIYDNPGSNIRVKSVKKLSRDTSINRFDYDVMRYDKKGLRPVIYYSTADRIHVGAAYILQRHGWRKEPFAQRHKLDVKYSLGQNALSTTYNGIFTELIGKWNLSFTANYDWERWRNFYGLGNTTPLETTDRDYNRMRSREGIVTTSFERNFTKQHTLFFTPYIQVIEIVRDTDRFVGKFYVPGNVYDKKRFAGIEAGYEYIDLNDRFYPTKGFTFRSASSCNLNLVNKDLSFGRITAETNIFIPIAGNFGFLSKIGGATLIGTPEFFQYNGIGGTQTMRGFQRDRFFGDHSVYNQNEIRWMKDVKSYRMNGKFGLFAFLDDGRVWLKNENSDKWHFGYGGGFLLSPFNKITFAVAYGFSEDDTNLHLEIIKPF